MMSKKQTLIIGIVAILVVVAGFHYWKRTQDTQPGAVNTPTLLQYNKPADGVSFMYPETYIITEQSLDLADMQGKYLLLTPADATIPEAGEGPPGLSIVIFENPETTPLADWLQTITSGTPMPIGGWDSVETTVGGEPAIAYTATGLYESDNIAVAHGTKVYVFSAAWLTREDQTIKDLHTLLASVKFL